LTLSINSKSLEFARISERTWSINLRRAVDFDRKVDGRERSVH
jgi:hypothetical protein